MKEYISIEAALHLLAREPEQRPRIYSELISGEARGQIVKLTSVQRLEQYEADLGSIWISHTTIEDIVRSK